MPVGAVSTTLYRNILPFSAVGVPSANALSSDSEPSSTYLLVIVAVLVVELILLASLPVISSPPLVWVITGPLTVCWRLS